MSIPDLKRKLEASLDHLKTELAKIRTGRATPALVEGITIEAYESKMTLREVGAINILDPQTIAIVPWDKSLLKVIDKAIRESDLNLNPVTDGEMVRVPVPDLTEDRRKEFAKLVSAKVEEAKSSMRNVRQEAMKDIDKDFTDKKIGEDEKFALKDDVEEVVKSFVDLVEEVGVAKKEDILKV